MSRSPGPADDTRPPSLVWGRRALLAAIVVVAALLRFHALGWGLRHAPDMDERYFVENVWLMLTSGDLDHRYYEYPGFFFYILTPALAFVKTAAAPDAHAYLVARGVVAAFGVANVVLLHRFGLRLASPGAALVAALFLALSPVDIQTSHMVRADVVLESFVLLALMAFCRIGERAGDDARAGLALGAAVAVKFTGLLLVASYLAHRLLAPGRRLRGLLLAALVCALAFALLSPYAILHARAFLEGATTQVTYHYQQQPRGASAPLGMALAYAAVWPKALGWPGTLLAAAGLVLVRRAWRTWAPLLVLPLTTLLAFSTQEYRFDRHLVPSFGLLALAAGIAVAALGRRQRLLAVAVALGAAAFPLAASLSYLRGLGRPSTKDRVIDWIAARVAPGARIASAVEGLGFDRTRFEVLPVKRLRRRGRLQALNADVVVVSHKPDLAALRDLPAAFVARPDSPWAGSTIRVHLVTPELRPRYAPVSLDAARFQASQNPDALAAIHDGRLDTCWEAVSRRAEDWVSAALPSPVLLGRVELALGERPESAGRGLTVAISDDGQRWRRLRTWPGRPVSGQVGPPSQLLLFEPARARFVRVVRTGRGGRPWAVAELRLDAVSPATPRPE